MSRLGRLATAALLVSPIGLVQPPSAVAGSGDWVRMFEDPDWAGSVYVHYEVGQAPGDRANIDGWNGDNEISSLFNLTGKWVILWDNDDYTGTRRCISPATHSVSNLALIGFDNRAESFQLTTSTMC